MVRRLYDPHAHPFVKVVCGISGSQDQNTAAIKFPSKIKLVRWSPCGRFIAVIWSNTLAVDILDPVTLQRLQTLKAPQDTPIGHGALSFSPDSHVLTFSTIVDNTLDSEFFVIVWNIQTGGIVNTIKGQAPERELSGRHQTSIVYSVDGKMIGVFYPTMNDVTIFICNLTSGVHVYTHSFKIPHSRYKRSSNNIWTHGESLRFTTATQMTITIWEVGFAQETVPKEVEVIPIRRDTFGDQPELDPQQTSWILFLPTVSRFAATNYRGTLLVWGAQDSKPLLHCEGIGYHPRIYFSSDGRFLACPTTESEIYLWEESPTGYTLQGVLTFKVHFNLLFSPSGESVLVFGDHLIRLWQTRSVTTPPSSTQARALPHTRGFVIDFSPDGTLAVFARLGEDIATVLNLKSGVPQLTVHASNGVYGLKMTRDTIVIISNNEIITWNLPVGDCASDSTMNIEDSSQVVFFSQRRGGNIWPINAASISPDLCYVAVISHAHKQDSVLGIYSISTGEFHENVYRHKEIWHIPQFTQDGSKIRCSGSESELWTIIMDRHQDGSIELISEPSRVDPQNPPEGYPWESSYGYQTTNDRWVLSPAGKRLLMLPPPWQSDAVWRMWNGQFLVLLHGGLMEPVILELES